MPSDSLARFNQLPLSLRIRVDAACCEFEDAWRAGDSPKLETYLDQFPGPHREALLTELLSLKLEYRRGRGETPELEAYAARLPTYDAVVREVFGTGSTTASLTSDEADATLPSPQQAPWEITLYSKPCGTSQGAGL
jgi:hypothetical protein